MARDAGASRPVGAALLVASLLLALGGCGGDGTSSGPRGPVRAGDDLPEFRGSLLEGDSLSLSALGGPALVNLWATWCPPCRHEIPYLQELSTRYASRGLRVVGISSDGPRAVDQVREFVAQAGVTYDIVLDPLGETMDLFRVVGLPATYLVDRDGVVTLARTGPVSEADTAFVAEIEALLEAR